MLGEDRESYLQNPGMQMQRKPPKQTPFQCVFQDKTCSVRGTMVEHKSDPEVLQQAPWPGHTSETLVCLLHVLVIRACGTAPLLPPEVSDAQNRPWASLR